MKVQLPIPQSDLHSEDGSLIASGSDDGTVKIWDTTDSSSLIMLSDSPRVYITSVEFLPNRTLVAAESFGAVRIWDVESQKLRAEMVVHVSRIKHVKFSPDGSKLVSVSFTSINVWDAETGSLPAFDNAYRSSIEWLTFSDGGEIVVQASGKLEKLKLCAVSTSSPTSGPSEEMVGTSTPLKLVLSTDDELTIQLPSPSYCLVRERSKEWDRGFSGEESLSFARRQGVCLSYKKACCWDI